MSNVLIRDVPSEDLERIRSAAAERGTSLQNYLLEAVHAQAAHLRRQDALTRIDRRLQDLPAVPDAANTAVLDAIDDAHDQRADELGGDRSDH